MGTKRLLLGVTFVLGLFVGSAAIAQLPEAPGSTIGYATVQEALQALRALPGVTFTTQQGWTIAEDEAHKTIWSFAPEGDPAYPAAVKREILQKDGGIYIQMNVLCQATKAACDQLVTSFQKMNDAIRQNLSRPKEN